MLFAAALLHTSTVRKKVVQLSWCCCSKRIIIVVEWRREVFYCPSDTPTQNLVLVHLILHFSLVLFENCVLLMSHINELFIIKITISFLFLIVQTFLSMTIQVQIEAINISLVTWNLFTGLKNVIMSSSYDPKYPNGHWFR